MPQQKLDEKGKHEGKIMMQFMILNNRSISNSKQLSETTLKNSCS